LDMLRYTERRLGQMIRERMASYDLRVRHLAQGLVQVGRLIQQRQTHLTVLADRLALLRREMLALPRMRVAAMERVLTLLHPRAPLARGFALVHGVRGLVTRAVDADGRVTQEFADGRRDATVV
jgi:exonuclease VII large subunit